MPNAARRAAFRVRVEPEGGSWHNVRRVPSTPSTGSTMNVHRLAITSLTFLLIACGGEATPDPDDDSGQDTPDAGSDALISTRDANDDAATDDPCIPLQPIACTESSECSGGQTCLRGSCVDLCDASLDGWNAAMPEGLVPVRNVCAVTGVMAVGGDPMCVGRARAFAVTSKANGDQVTHEVRAGALEDGPTDLLTTADVDPNGQTHFLGLNAAASPSGERVAWGYTLSSVAGEVLVADGDGTISRWPSTGNYDVDWQSEDILFVNGLSLGESREIAQGLYGLNLATEPATTARLTTGPGSSSGAVSWAPRLGEVLVGGSEGLDGTVYAVPRDRLSFDAPIDLATSDLTSFTTASDFELLAGRWLAGYDSTYTSYEYRELADDVLLEPQPFIDTDVFFENVPIRGTDRFLLVHANGYLIVEVTVGAED